MSEYFLVRTAFTGSSHQAAWEETKGEISVFSLFLHQHSCNNYSLLIIKMTDRYNIHSQLEHLQSKYIGTGHADTSKWEWLVNQHRDSYCSYMGHFDLLNYFSVAENESKARVRFNLMEKMLQPCGPPADKPDDS
ncbi:splicing factor 3B subunit 5 [Nerophis ophidion]|nr:splicing factor 3B subunit 5 [Nerophis ophidion]